MKILDIVKFNDSVALVVDDIPALTYEKCGQALDWEDEGDSEKENLNSTYNRIRLTVV